LRRANRRATHCSAAQTLNAINEEQESAMNSDTLKGDWKKFKGKVKEQWGKLTDDELERLEGRGDQLAGAIQKRYGIAKEEAERQVKEFEKRCSSCDDSTVERSVP
jgi:uncharacterized protein YjbJ (UPF0337 family)